MYHRLHDGEKIPHQLEHCLGFKNDLQVFLLFIYCVSCRLLAIDSWFR